MDTAKCKQCTAVASFDSLRLHGCLECGAEPYLAIIGERRADLSKPRQCRVAFSESAQAFMEGIK